MDPSKAIELDLVRRCQRGEADAFDSLYDKYGDSVWRLCRRMAGNPVDADDLAQEAWVTVWRQIAGFRCESSFHTWLYRVTSNVCLQWLRKMKNKQTIAIDEALLVAPTMLESEVTDKAELGRLVAALSQLPETLRLPLVLRVDEDLSYTEIAQILDCTHAAVKMRISRARAMLAAMMEDTP